MTEQPSQIFPEADEDTQLFLPLHPPRRRGRFLLPQNGLERWQSRLKEAIDELSDGTPPACDNDEWQIILDYLHRNDIISTPRFLVEKIPNDMPRIFSYRLQANDPGSASDGTSPQRGYSRGVSRDREEAASKVVGELLERYPLTIYRRKDLLRASMNHLRERKIPFLNLHNLAGFAEWQKEQHPMRKFDDASVFFWSEGKELLSGERTLIPAQLIFWNYSTAAEPREPYLRQPITNGAAGHFTRREAILAGIYEAVQRDAFLVLWFNQIPPPRIDPATLPSGALRDLVEECERHHFEVALLDTTWDTGIPSCVSVLIDRSGYGPKIALGGGCGFDMERALYGGLIEALGIYQWLRLNETPASVRDPYIPFQDDSIGQAGRLLFWSDPAMFPKIKPFFCGPLVPFGWTPSRTFSSPEEELFFVKEIFRRLGPGYEVFVYEAAHPVLKALGYHSVRVIIPALIPLHLLEPAAVLGARRIRETPARLGHVAAREVMPLPSPFP